MTKLTNEELLTKYLAELAGDFTDTDDRDAYRAEILQRMAEGAAGEAAPQGEIRLRYEAACKMVHDLCHGNRRWTMSVPARPDYDPDIVISSSLADIPQLLSGSASTAGPRPRCPKCQSGFILLNYNLWVDDGKRSQHQATCRECEYELTLDSTPADFAQFFAAAPAEDAKEKA